MLFNVGLTPFWDKKNGPKAVEEFKCTLSLKLVQPNVANALNGYHQSFLKKEQAVAYRRCTQGESHATLGAFNPQRDGLGEDVSE